LVGLLLRPLEGLGELLLEQALAVLHRRLLLLEQGLGARLALVEAAQQAVEVLAAGRRARLGAMGEHLAGGGVDHQLGLAVGAADVEAAAGGAGVAGPARAAVAGAAARHGGSIAASRRGGGRSGGVAGPAET